MFKTVLISLVLVAAVASAAIPVTMPEPSAIAELGTAAAGVGLVAWRMFRKRQ
jgi:hypothetical protein